MQTARWIQIYYLATPLFAAADAFFGANVRAVGLAGHPGWRAAWYAGCLACGIVGWLRPRWAGALGLAESGLNLLTLALAVFLPILDLAEQVSSGAPGDWGLPFGPGFVANLLLSSAACIALFHARGGGAWRGGRPALS